MAHIGNLKGLSRKQIGALIIAHFDENRKALFAEPLLEATKQSNVIIPQNSPFIDIKTDGKSGKIGMTRNQPIDRQSITQNNVKMRGNGSKTTAQIFQIPEPKKQINPLIILGIVVGGFFILKFMK